MQSTNISGRGASIIISLRLKGCKKLSFAAWRAQRGVFLPAVQFPLSGTPGNLAVGDLNSDGRTDVYMWLFLASSGFTPNGELAVSLQQPDGTLAPILPLAPQTGLNAGRLAVADYNGDSRNDLFAFFTPFSSDYVGKITVLLQGTSPGTFTAPYQL